MWDHYVDFPELPDWNGRVFTNKAEQVKAELWVISHLCTMLVNTSHLLDILEIMTRYIACICIISSDSRRDTRPGWLLWLTKPYINL